MNTAVRTVTVMPPSINPMTHLTNAPLYKLRVAAYARVSTDSDEQFTSYEAQIDYYTQYIQRNPEWTFVKVYTDEGISGTNTKHRAGFNEMIEDALAGKIDLIVTKSVSRFARNTVDSLVTIRKLKEKGVQVYFEKENIYTFDGKGELLLTIMSSLAQEESRSISENVTWGQRKRFADGKVNLPYKNFLGYRKGADGFPEVIPEEAVIVRRIYSRFMAGQTTAMIAKDLTADGILTPARKQRWQSSTVESILKNEKYKGAALLQKCFTVDFLTKKRKVNEGEVPWSTATSRLFPRRNSTKYRQNLNAESSSVGSTAGKASLLPALFVRTAVLSSAPRCGTPTANTARSSGSATGSFEAKRNARRRIWMSAQLKTDLWRRSTSSLATKSASLMTAA